MHLHSVRDMLLASSLEYAERIRVDSVVETSDCSLLVCLQIFSFFPLSSFSFYTVQYRRVQYSTVIGQLPRVSREDPERIRVDSVVETSDCLFSACLLVSKFSHFFLFHPPLFIQYSTEECSTVQYIGAGP